MSIIALDIETSNGHGAGSLEPRDPDSHVALVQLAHEDGTIEVLRPTNEVIDRIRGYISDGYKFIIHNAAFEIDWFRVKYGIEFTDIWCTMIASQMLNAGKNQPDEASDRVAASAGRNLSYLGRWETLFTEEDSDEEAAASRFLHSLQAVVYRYADGAMIQKDQGNSDWTLDPLTEEQLRYAQDDVRYLFTVYNNQRKFIAKLGMEQAVEIDMEALIPVTLMKHVGLLVDREEWLKEAEDYGKKAAVLEEVLNDKFGMELAQKEQSVSLFGAPIPKKFKVSSPAQLKKFFGTKKADEQVLRTLDHPLIKDLLVYKEYQKISSTYGETYLSHIREDGRIHATLKQADTATGRFSSSAPNLQNCYSYDTEILTEGGWVRFDTLEHGVKVAQFNKDTDSIDFVIPTGYVNKPFEGNMLHIESVQLDFLVTPDHRMLFEQRNTGVRKDVLAKDWVWDYKIPMAGNFVGGTNDSLTDDELAFIVAVQADAWVGPNGTLDFTFHKDRKKERLTELLERLGYVYTSKESAHRTHRVRFLVKDDRATRLVSEYLGEDKKFGSWVLNLSRRLLDHFVDELWEWDGLHTRKTNWASQHEDNTDIVQAALVLSGRRARKRVYVSGGGSVSHQVDSPPSRTYAYTTNIVPTEVPYNDFVYCVTVPSSYVVVRRNGKVAVSGNCPADMMKSYMRADPGKVIVTMDYSAVESRILAYLAEDPALIKSVNSSDVHWENAKKIFHLPENASRNDLFNVGDKRVAGDELRRKAKGVSFGIPYGISCEGLVNRGFADTKEEGEILINNFLSQYSKVKDFLDKSISEALTKGFTQTPTGRIRWYQMPKTNDRKLRELAAKSFARQGQNHKIQGASADITKRAIADIGRYLSETERGHLILTIHDSIIAEINLEDAGTTVSEMVRLMEEAGPKVIPGIVTPVDADVGHKEVRKCSLTGLYFKVYTYTYDGTTVGINTQEFEPRVEKIVRGSSNPSQTLRNFMMEQSQEWREKNKDIIIGYQETTLGF